jgi:hypothetical protein
MNRTSFFSIALVALLQFIVSSKLVAQTSGGNLALHVVVTDAGTRQSPSIKSLLESKLLDMVTTSGLGGGKGGRFYITPKVVILNEQVVSGPPAKVLTDVLITFYIGDNVDQKIVNSASKELKGVGSTPEQAVMQAIRSLNARDKTFTDCVAEARKRIIDYYNQNCEAIIASAFSLSLENIGAAMESLSMIPMDNSSCYIEAQDKLQLLYANYVRRRCSEAMAEARLIWAASYSKASAEKAVAHIRSFRLDEDCAREAVVLAEEMKTRVEGMEQYDREFTTQLLELEGKRMELTADVLKEFFRNQPQPVYHTDFIFID